MKRERILATIGAVLVVACAFATDMEHKARTVLTCRTATAGVAEITCDNPGDWTFSAARREIRIGACRNEAVPLKTIWYEVFIPFRLLGTDAAALRKSGLMVNAMLNDNDGRCREGYLSFAPGNPWDPANFILVDFREK